jgi:N-acetylmuramoyl-L-alanine amidase
MNPLAQILQALIKMFTGTKVPVELKLVESKEETPTPVEPAPVIEPAKSYSIQWKASPNHKNRKAKIEAIIIHHTANTATFSGLMRWMTKKESKVSAHYFISKKGAIVQMVKDERIAYHAGKSELNGRKWVNNFSIGIECDYDSRHAPMTSEMYDALVWLTSELTRKYSIDAANVVDHRTVSPSRKPFDLVEGSFDWGQFYTDCDLI